MVYLSEIMFFHFEIIACLVMGALSQSSHTEDPRRCVAGSGVTAFSVCQAWDSLVASCGSYASTSDATGYFNCYCQQNYLNALYDCNNEERLCIPQYASQIDQDFTDDYYSWHSWCDPVVIYTPTTPLISSITASYDGKYCSTVQSACESMSNSRNQCYATWTSGAGTTAYSSCVCAPPVLSLEYTCSFLGNISCLQVPAHLSNLAGATYCDNLEQVLSVPASVTSSLGTGTTNRVTYYTPSTTTPSPGETVPSGGTTATSTAPAQSSSGAANQLLRKAAGGGGFGGLQIWRASLSSTLATVMALALF